MRAAGLVLAGGASRRMGGGQKFLLDLGGRTLLDHALERLRPQVGALAISANCQPGLLPPGLPALPDRQPSRGPLSGLLSGLAWAARQPGATHLATVAADTPFFPDDLVRRLGEAIGDGKAALAASGGRVHPTFGLWSLDVLPLLEEFLRVSATSRVADFAAGLGAASAAFDAGSADPFFNVNTAADLEEARRIVQARFP